MNLFFLCINFFIGSCLASHALVIFEHWPKIDFIISRSQCANCQCQLSLIQEIPILSFCLLKGHCFFCKYPIPRESFLFEIIGGFLFCTIDFSNFNKIITSIFLFSFLLIAISDYYQNSFDLFFIIPAFLVATIFNQYASFTLIDWLSFFIISIIFIIGIFNNQIGLGDFLAYFIISSYYKPNFANITFLLAAIILLIKYLLEQDSPNYQYPFIFYILLGLIIAIFMTCKKTFLFFWIETFFN